jgi:hypothetical protein
VLAEGTNQFLEAQLEDARRRLIEQERRSRRIATVRGQLPSQLESNLQVLQNSQIQVQSILESINRDSRLDADPGASDCRSRTTGQAALVVAAPLRCRRQATPAQALAAAKATLATLQSAAQTDHPDILRLNRLIRDLENKVEQDAQERRYQPKPRTCRRAETARRRRSLS